MDKELEKLTVITPKWDSDRQAMLGMLRGIISRIEGSQTPVTGVAIIVTFGNRSIGTEYESIDPVAMAGAASYLQQRMMDELVDG